MGAARVSFDNCRGYIFMANTRSYLRSAAPGQHADCRHVSMMVPPAVAQDNGSRDNNGERGERGGRGGRRDRDRRDDDRPADRPAAAQSTASATPSANSFGTVSDVERIKQSATETIKANDKNSNGILEGDELAELRMSRAADTDNDGKITHDELVKFRMPKSTTTTATKPATAAPAGGQPTSTEPIERKIVNKSRKSYRFKSTKDRINSWKFSSRDANSDGQVSMNEFTRTWNDRTAREFQGYDKDNDGMITVEEAK